MPKQRTKEEAAAYMRDYRARKSSWAEQGVTAGPSTTKAVYTGPVSNVVGTFSNTVGEAGPEVVRVLKPSFLAAPNDDCAACGHDRQTFHTAGPCTAPNGRRRCSCPDFVPVLFDD